MKVLFWFVGRSTFFLDSLCIHVYSTSLREIKNGHHFYREFID